MDLKEIGINTRNWVDSTQNRDYLRALVNAVIEPPDSISHGFSLLLLCFTVIDIIIKIIMWIEACLIDVLSRQINFNWKQFFLIILYSQYGEKETYVCIEGSVNQFCFPYVILINSFFSPVLFRMCLEAVNCQRI